MRVKFLRNYDYKPSLAPRSLVAFKKGYEGTVKQECADAAIADGAAVAVNRKPRARS